RADPAGAAAGDSGGAGGSAAGALGGRHYAYVYVRRAAGGAHRHRRAAAAAVGARRGLQGPAFERELAGGHLRQPGEGHTDGSRRMSMGLNLHAIRAIYRFEMARTGRTLMQSIAAPVLTTSLYFVVFGSAIGSRMGEIDGVGYGAFIIPGLIM